MQIRSLASQDYIAVYQDAVSALEGREDETLLEALNLKHKAVLALARAGASDFAQGEYDRYGLGRVKQHEDIMALAGRLAKDRFEQSGDVEEARVSANFYEAAFQATGGYYSAINAATMSLLAKVPPEIVMARAQAVLARLSSLSGETEEDRYFIQASRAEAHYILGDKVAAGAALQSALDFDPLNYTAHASTYRQFSLLAKAHDEDMAWLKPLRAPISVHFAGHLFGTLKDEDRLSVAISDLIQKEDIGFGYGALAAGSDIVFAEALLAEGGELHVILPIAADLFKQKSVEALDNKKMNWSRRFDDCLSRASSVRVVSDYKIWPDARLNNFVARIAMGEASLRANALSSLAGQALIWDGQEGLSLTAQHAKDWKDSQKKYAAPDQTGRPHYIIDFPDARSSQSRAPQTAPESPFKLRVGLARNGEKIGDYDTLDAALDAAKLALQNSETRDSFGMHIAMTDGEGEMTLPEALSTDALPGALLVSRDLAAILALDHNANWQTGFVGWSEASGEKRPAYFARPLTGPARL